jgi:hypothetical protein
MSWIARPLVLLAIAVALTTAARAEEKCDADSGFPAQARDAVRQYATDGGRVAYHGIAATRLDGSTYVAVVDFGDGRDLMVLLVRRFIDDKGDGYWKAAAVDPDSAALFGNRLKGR